MKFKLVMLFLGAGALLLLAGCNLGDSKPTCTGSSDLVAPVRTGPAQFSVVDSLTPTLSWSYSSPDCVPPAPAIPPATGGVTAGSRPSR